MPKYDYRCNACGHEFEAEQRMSDSALKECPSCHKAELERLISRTTFTLKGGGWYKDGYEGSGKPRIGDKMSDDKKSNGDKLTDAIKKSE